MMISKDHINNILNIIIKNKVKDNNEFEYPLFRN